MVPGHDLRDHNIAGCCSAIIVCMAEATKFMVRYRTIVEPTTPHTTILANAYYVTTLVQTVGRLSTAPHALVNSKLVGTTSPTSTARSTCIAVASKRPLACSQNMESTLGGWLVDKTLILGGT